MSLHGDGNEPQSVPLPAEGSGSAGSEPATAFGTGFFGSSNKPKGKEPVERKSSGGDTVKSPNMGLVRNNGKRRIVGGGIRGSLGVMEEPARSYAISDSLQFFDYEELQVESISSGFAQELVEELFFKRWVLDSSNKITNRKAEDLLAALFILRTASAETDYDVHVLIGSVVVDCNQLSHILLDNEVTRRRFSRGRADRTRDYLSHKDNVKLRDMVATKLGVSSEYAHLAFDGSTHCSGMTRHQKAFTKAIADTKLFDKPESRVDMTSQSLLDAGFQTRRGPPGAARN